MGKTVVVGLARSGVGAANLLQAMGREVVVTDTRPSDVLAEYTAKLSPSVGLALGGHPTELFEDAELIVLSPGVPLYAEPVRMAREAGIKVIGELELAFRMLPGIPVYAVTGTNGKSTTVTLLNLMLKNAGRRTLLAGNIGNALSEEILKRANGDLKVGGVDCVVVEVSSFQLEAIEEFRPAGAAILNITPDHMDRYATLREYRDAKQNIAMNQGEGDFLVLNADDPECEEIFKALEGSSKVSLWSFSRKRKVKGVYLDGDSVVYDLGDRGKGTIIRQDDISIKGVHNLENAMAASAMALLAGSSVDAVRESLAAFHGLEHRLEHVRELDGVRYINDSKGTNVGAVVKSLESFDTPVVLIAGGRDKAGDFSQLEDAVKAKVKAMVLIGEAKDKIGAALSGFTECHEAATLEDAVTKARDIASAGDVVLLSPACASFDMFADFEDRGRKFKEIVNSL